MSDPHRPGQVVGYVRVSTLDQSVDRQLVDVHLDRVFTDHVSGARADRPALRELVAYVRDGDEVVVHSLDRLARNLDDLRSIVKELTAKGITVRFVKENMVFRPGASDPLSTLLLSVLGAFAEFERALIRERQREGIAMAKAKGTYRGSGPRISDADLREMRKLLEAGVPRSAVAKAFGIARQTLYKREVLERMGWEPPRGPSDADQALAR